MKKLKQRYREETNKEPYDDINQENNYTRHYVKWLEKQLAPRNVRSTVLLTTTKQITMTDTLISLEAAKLAIEKGFDWRVKPFYNGLKNNNLVVNEIIGSANQLSNWYPAPTQSLLQKWLRDEHEIYISINTTTSYRTNGTADIDDHEYIPVHQYRIIKNIDNWKYEVVEYSDEYEDYNECLDGALIDGLKLIKNDNTTDS